MMMKLILLISLTLFTSLTKGQNNDLNPNSSWHCWDLDGTSQCKDTYDYHLYFNGDSIINGNQYLKLYSMGNHYNSYFSASCPSFNQSYNYFTALVRYDQNKLFLLNGATEQTYIDYNLQVGDTIKNVLFTQTTSFTPLKITRIDSVNLSGNYLNRFFYQSTNSTDTGYVIEKIGSNHGFISEFTPFFESFKELVCYAENNITVYDDQNLHHTSCNVIQNLHENDSYEFEMYPNPTANGFTLKTESGNQLKKAFINNYLGQVVMNFNQSNSSTSFDISPLERGIYFIIIETETGTVAKKIIKQ